GGDRVLPLPVGSDLSVLAGMDDDEIYLMEEYPTDWQLEFNTRWVSEYAFDDVRHRESATKALRFSKERTDGSR
ncbi:MAG: hypothetical protein ACPGXK_11885, partial [Phycisphaerae bacterium]